MGDLILSPGSPVPDLVTSSGGITATLAAAAPTGATTTQLTGGTAPTDLLENAGVLPGALQVGVIGIPGPPGVPGPQNLFIQQAQPVMATEGMWVELRGDGSVKTIWVGTT